MVFLWIASALINVGVAQAGQRNQAGRFTRVQAKRILDYNSGIEVRSDASMVVTKTIRVVSAQIEIRHGIYREFPTEYTDRLGNHYVVEFELLGATRDGAPESTRVENQANGKRIYLGRSDFLLPKGEYTYTITYTTNRQLGFFPDHDEPFWNVTGNGWAFAIEHASAEVHLPANGPATDVRISGYTGPQGAMASELTSSTNPDGTFQFETTRALPPNSGLTILLTFPTGYFTPPTTAERLRHFAQDNRDSVIALAGFSFDSSLRFGRVGLRGACSQGKHHPGAVPASSWFFAGRDALPRSDGV